MSARKPKAITTRSLIREVAKRWREQYGSWASHSSDKKEIWNQLKLLDGETATRKDVQDIIGNDSWTALRCDQCDKSVAAVAEVGNEPDYDSATAHICEPCLRKALDVLAETTRTEGEAP